MVAGIGIKKSVCCCKETKEENMNHIEIVELLVKHLPNSNCHDDDPTWGYSWEELSGDAQEAVETVCKAAWEFISEHQLDKLTSSVDSR